MQLFQIDPKDLTGHFDHIIASSAKVGESVRRLVIRTTIGFEGTTCTTQFIVTRGTECEFPFLTLAAAISHFNMMGPEPKKDLKLYLTGSLMGDQIIAKLEEEIREYRCIPTFCRGNSTQVSQGGVPIQGLREPKFHDTLEQAQRPGQIARQIANARREDESIIAGRPRIYG